MKSCYRIIFMFTMSMLLLGNFAVHTLNSHAQSDGTETPDDSISIQENALLNNMQLLSIGQLVTETGILPWQTQNYIGQGIKVGVIDQGFGMLDNFESTNQIEVKLPPGYNRADINTDAIIHGTDVLTIIREIVPGAELYACKYLNFNEFTGCVDWFIASGIQIVNHSAGVPALPLDGTNLWAQEVDRISRTGTLWINSAGNFAGGYVNDILTDIDNNSYHEFRGRDIIERLEIPAVGDVRGRILLSWESLDGFPANSIDLDLEIVNEFNEVVAASSQTQSPQDEYPIELVSVTMNQPLAIRIRYVEPFDGLVRFVLYTEFASVSSGRSDGSIIAPADSLSALTVGALRGNAVAPYSSRGPLVNGAIKPDVVAPGEVILPDGRIFVGTSAAAPVVAGIAALIWDVNPALSRRELFDLLRDGMTIDDGEIPGPDNTYGYGSLYLRLPDTLISTDANQPPAVAIAPTQLFDCPGALATRLQPGARGIVRNRDDSLVNVRTGAGTLNARVDQLSPLQIFDIVTGPECIDNIVWYQVNYGERTGWIAEGIYDEFGQEFYFVEPIADSEGVSEGISITCNQLISEDFNGPTRNTWFLGTGIQSSVAVNNGGYELSIFEGNERRQPVAWGSIQDVNFTANLRITGEIYVDTFSDDSERTGIWFNYRSSDEYTAIMLRSDGTYNISDYEFGYTPIVNWTPSSAINTGDNVTNLIDFVRIGDSYSLSINGEFVTSISPERVLREGRVAFFGASSTVPNVFRLENIRICGS